MSMSYWNAICCDVILIGIYGYEIEAGNTWGVVKYGVWPALLGLLAKWTALLYKCIPTSPYFLENFMISDLGHISY